MEHSIWALEESVGIWLVWGLLRAGCAKPSCAIVTTGLLLLLGRRPLLFSDTLLPWTSSHPVQMGGWSPQAAPLLHPCYGLGLSCLSLPLLSNRSPGPLRFRHMSGEVTLTKTGMSLGASRPPLSDQVANLL